MTEEVLFDEQIDRRNTHSAKWDTMDNIYQREGMIHCGVADMDFRVPEPICKALEQVLKKGVLGYTDTNEAFFESIKNWYEQKHGVEVKREWIVFCPRINIACGLFTEAFSRPADEVCMHVPAYKPLKSAVECNRRMLVDFPLRREGTHYKMDWEDMEQCITERTKLMILCNPHNPTGRCWTESELRQLATFCKKHGLILFVDEIHGDLIKAGCSFHSALEFREDFGNQLIIASSPAKTFNIPGVILSYMIIPDEGIRRQMKAEINRVGLHNPTVFAVDALITAYTECEDWYYAVKYYIDENEHCFREFIKEFMPEFQIMDREGTYLMWVDYTGTGKTAEEMEAWFLDKANVSVYMGTDFGDSGKGYLRFNIATSRRTLKDALKRMKHAKDW